MRCASLFMAACLAAAPAGLWAQDQADQPPSDVTTERDVIRFIPDGDQAQLSEYWIGTSIRPVDPTLAAQLGLEEGTGVTVNDVLADSPAAKAGMKSHDVIVAIDDQVIHGHADIFQAVDAKKGAEISVRLLRGGKEMTLAVKPEKRPADAGNNLVPRDGEDAWFDFAPRMGGNRFNMRFFGPGFQWHRDEDQAKFPEGLSISIAKSGDGPAKVTVKRGDQTWEVDENELGELPDDVRPHVESLLGKGGPVVWGFRGDEGERAFDWQGSPEIQRWFRQGPRPEIRRLPPGGPRPDAAPGRERMERRLDNLTRRLEQLMDEIRDLRDGQDSDGAPAAEPAPGGNEKAIRWRAPRRGVTPGQAI
jgi:hypothetical protein